MLKEILALEIYEKFKHHTYFIEADFEQSLINELRLSMVLDKYNLQIPQVKIEHL